MSLFLSIVTCCTFGAFLISCTDVPQRRTIWHTLRSSWLLLGFVLCGTPILILSKAPHPFAVPLTYSAFLAWVALGAMWSIRLDAGAALRPVPAWILRWLLLDWMILATIGASVSTLFLSGGRG